VIDERTGESRQMALFPADRAAPATSAQIEALQVRLDRLRLSRPRQWGACWLGDLLWRRLRLDTFFAERLGHSREGTDWEKVLRVLTLYRLISPGSVPRPQADNPRRSRGMATPPALVRLHRPARFARRGCAYRPG
jgi:hypothetical protein